MVKIFVGTERKQWILPESLLCDRLKFFKATFRGGFRESKEKVLELPEDDPIAFGYILDRIFGLSHWQIPFNFGQDFNERQLMWCKVYVLEDRLGCQDSTDAENNYERAFEGEVERCLSEGKDLPLVSSAAVNYVYENTTAESPMRQALARCLASLQLMVPPMKESQIEDWALCAGSHPRFHVDVMTDMRGHIHSEAEDCVLSRCAIHPDP